MKSLLAFGIKKILIVIGMPLLILFQLNDLPKDHTEDIHKIVIEGSSEITGGTYSLGNKGITMVLVTDSSIRVLECDKQGNSALEETPLFRIKFISTPNGINDTFWKLSEDGYLYYYDPVSKNEIGSKDNPFNSTIHMDDEWVWYHIELPCELPQGKYCIYNVDSM